MLAFTFTYFFKSSYRLSGGGESVELLHIDVAAISRLDP